MLVGLVSIIFAQMLPTIDVNNVALAVAVAFVIFVNAAVSRLVRVVGGRSGDRWSESSG